MKQTTQNTKYNNILKSNSPNILDPNPQNIPNINPKFWKPQTLNPKP